MLPGKQMPKTRTRPQIGKKLRADRGMSGHQRCHT
jgi:hypothetical protein